MSSNTTPARDLCDLSEHLTGMARRCWRECLRKQVVFLFDYDGPLVRVRLPRSLDDCVEALLQQACTSADSGHVFLSITVQGNRSSCSVVLQVAGNHIATERALSRASLEQVPFVQWRALTPTETHLLASGTLPTNPGASVSILSVPEEGTVYRLQAQLDVVALLCQPEREVNAQNAPAWLIADAPQIYDTLQRRLRRLGWCPTVLRSAAEATARLSQAGATPPALVVFVDPRSAFDPVALDQLEARLPAACRILLASPETHDASALPAPRERAKVVPLPLSAEQLVELTRHAGNQRRRPLFSDRPAPPVAATEPPRPRILIVDDNELNRILAKEMVQLLGYEPVLAEDGLAAIACCEQAPPQAVLMDLHMPRMDGFETTRRLRERQRAGQLPAFSIIAATAGLATEQECRAAGLDGRLLKPLDMQLLRTELEARLNSRLVEAALPA